MFKFISTLFLLSYSSLSFSQNNLDIVQILGQFYQASYATSKCTVLSQELQQSFSKNFEIVSFRARESIKSKNKGISDSEISSQLNKGKTAVESQIESVIQSKGCSDPRIQDLLKRYVVQATLKF